MRTAWVTQALGVLGFGASVALGCSSSIESTLPSAAHSSTSERVGTVGLRLQPVSGVTVTGIDAIVQEALAA